MKKSDWKTDLSEIVNTNIASNNKINIDLSRKDDKKKSFFGSKKRKPVEKLVATRDRDGDGKLERKQKGGEYQEALLYDVVHDYIISENFASDTEGANKVMLKLSDELMQEIYERTMTASEKRKDTMLKKKYDDSDMKKNMQDQYGKEEGKKVYFATIRKQAMKKEEVESVEEKIKYDKSGSSMDYFLGADPKKTEYYKKNAKKKIKKEEVEQEDPSVKAKMKRQAMIKKQVLMKKLQAVRAGAGADITSSYDPQGEEVSEVVSQSMRPSNIKKKAKLSAALKRLEDLKVAAKMRKEEVSGEKVVKMVKAVTDEKKRKNALQIQKYIGEEEQLEGYGSDRVGPALRVARAIDSVNPRPTPNSKRTRASRALKLASIKKDEKIRKRQENPYSADKRLKMVATSIRDRVKQKAKALTRSEEVVTELNRYEKEKRIDTKTKKPITKGGTAKKDLAFQAVMKKYSSQRMGGNEPKKVKGVKSDEGTGRISRMLAKKKEQQAKNKKLASAALKAGYKSTQDYVNVQAVRKGGLGT